MSKTTTVVADGQPVLTRGTSGKAIFGELLQFISSPAVLTFEGKPYDNSQAESDYLTITIDGAGYGFIQQPDPGFNTTWVNFSNDQHVMTGDDIAYAKKINVTKAL